MLLRSTIALLAVFGIAAPAATQQPREQTARLKVRLEVSKQIAELFVVKDGRFSPKGKYLFLHDFHRITRMNDKPVPMIDPREKAQAPLWNNWDVEMVAVDVDTSRKPPAAKQSVDLLLQIQLHRSSPREVVPRLPPLANPVYDQQSAYFALAEFSFRCADVRGAFRGQVTCMGWPNEAVLKTAQLLGLEQLDDSLRTALGQRLIRSSRKEAQEKEGWYLENPFSFVVEGNYQSTEKDRDLMPFRLTPGSQARWVDTESGLVRDLFLSPHKSASPSP